MEKESALLTLHSGYASTLGEPILYFRNIPIKEILGDMYDKYKKFKLVLNVNACNANVQLDTRQYFVRVSGLDFINTTEYKTLNNYPRSAMFMLPSLYFQTINLNQLSANHGATFLKPSNHKIDLTIALLNRNHGIPTYNTGVNMFVFSIYGVDDD